MTQPSADERLVTLISNLEAAIKMADPKAGYYMLLLHVRELAEIVKLQDTNRSPAR